MWYLIAIYSIKTISKWSICGKETRYHIGIFLLVLCTAIQLMDMSSVLLDKHKNYTSKVEYEYAESDFWERLIQFRDFEHICISYQIHVIPDYMEWGALAAKYDMTINQFYFARRIDNMLDSMSVIEQEGPLADTIYVFLPEQKEALKNNEYVLRYYNVGRYVIGVSWLDDEGKVNDFSY